MTQPRRSHGSSRLQPCSAGTGQDRRVWGMPAMPQGMGLPTLRPRTSWGRSSRVQGGRSPAVPHLGDTDLQSCHVPRSPAVDGAVGFVRIDHNHQE